MNSTQMYTGDITEADKNVKKLFFRGCFMVLIATTFGFVFRAFIMAGWGIGTNCWITNFIAPAMQKMGFMSGYKLSPLGLLAESSLFAVFSLLFLFYSTGFLIIITASIFALGKTFFWPSMPGEVSEQFPKGGELAFNFTGAVCMMGLGRYRSSISWLHSG